MAKHIAYLTSRFPKISETFILYEILELQKRGVNIELFPLLREREKVMHPEAEKLAQRAHYVMPFSPAVILAQFFWMFRNPLGYFRCCINAIAGNWRFPAFLLRALFIIPVASYFAYQIERLGIEHVHAHWATHPTLAAWVIHQLTGVPYSFTAHAHDIYVQRPMLREKLNECAFAITISDYNKQFLERIYGKPLARKIHVIHCGVDPNVFRPRSNEKRSNRFTILCVASLSDYKGHAYLLEACSILKRSNVNFCCLLVGEGEARRQIENQIADLHLQQIVHLLGWQPREQVSDLMSKTDVMVLPSIKTTNGKKEGIPVALMEALAMELPVVATSISGIPELVEHGRTGLLVPEKDSEALADALMWIFKSPDLGRRLGEAGRSKVLESFHLSENAEQLLRLFERPQDFLVSPELSPQPISGSDSAHSYRSTLQNQGVPRC